LAYRLIINVTESGINAIKQYCIRGEHDRRRHAGTYTAAKPVRYLRAFGKEVQDTSCRRSGGVPQLLISPKIGG
jgi:hypothetical protein